MIELSRGQETSLVGADGQPLVRLQLGLGWDKEPGAGFIGNGTPDIDLDASALQFAGGQLFDIAFYNNLRTRDGSVVHQGDNLTGRGEGDDERIKVDLGAVYAQVDTIVFVVSSYQGQTLEWVDNAYCRILDEYDAELVRFTLTAGTPRTGLVMATLHRETETETETEVETGADGAGALGGWRIKAVGQGVAVTVPTESLDALTRFL